MSLNGRQWRYFANKTQYLLERKMACEQEITQRNLDITLQTIIPTQIIHGEPHISADTRRTCRTALMHNVQGLKHGSGDHTYCGTYIHYSQYYYMLSIGWRYLAGVLKEL